MGWLFKLIKKSFDEFKLDVNKSIIRKGEVLGVIGANGLGKSTFLKLLNGELKPDSGKLENIDIKKGAYITKPDAYQKYALWANTNGHRPITTIRFAIEFFRLYMHTTKKHSRQASGERINFWPNLAWKKDGIPAEVNEQMTWEE